MTERPGDIKLPFEAGDSFDMDLSDGVIASGVVVMAAVLPVPDVGPMPCLVFRFAKPDGSGFLPPVVLACSPADLAGIRHVVADAVSAAITAAGGGRRA